MTIAIRFNAWSDRSWLRLGALMITLSATMTLFGCTQQKTHAAEDRPLQSASAQPPSKTSPSDAANLLGSVPRSALTVSGEHALQHTRDLVAFGPRYVGSRGHKLAEDYLRQHLKRDDLEEDNFTANTPNGKFPMTNFIAKFPGTKDGIIVLSGHYDTIYKRNDFVGANDGGSSAGLLLALADNFRSQMKNGKRQGYSVWLVWFDGEEAFQQWSDTDSIYGSRHLAGKWQKDGTAARVKAFLLADMVGDANLNIDRDLNSTDWLEEDIYSVATWFGYQSHFFQRRLAIEDDHIPFAKIGIPVADLIDFDYGYDNTFWHTSEDTMDKLSPESLRIVGDVMLGTVQLLDRK